MSIADSSIYRVYTCTNDSCLCEVAFQEKVSDKWRKACPLCKKRSLVLDRATCSISTLIDTKNPRTLGGISQKNLARKEKEYGLEEKRTPFWRKKKKIDFSVLKDPKKYIATGNK